MSFVTPSASDNPQPPQGFATPGQFPQSQFEVSEHVGALVLIRVLGIEEMVPTVRGDKAAARVNIDVLHGPGAGEAAPDVFLFQTVLLRVCRNAFEAAGRQPVALLGRITMGEGKPGQNAPYLLADPTDADRQLATQFLAGAFRPPAPPAPVGNPYGQPQPQAGNPYGQPQTDPWAGQAPRTTGYPPTSAPPPGYPMPPANDTPPF